MPVRVEVGPRDLAQGLVTLVRRDTGEKVQAPLAEAAARVAALVEQIQADMLAAATERRDAATVEVATIDDAAEAAQTGFARLPWAAVRGEGEAAAGRQGHHRALPRSGPTAASRRPRTTTISWRWWRAPIDRAGRVRYATVRDGRGTAILQRPFRSDSSPFERFERRRGPGAHAFRMKGRRAAPMTVADRVRDLVLPLLTERDLDLYDVEVAGPVLQGGRRPPGRPRPRRAGRRHPRRVPSPRRGRPHRRRLHARGHSPGLERRLRTPRHFARAVGESVKVKLTVRRRRRPRRRAPARGRGRGGRRRRHHRAHR